jgi:DNA-directed RNA polymerase subunit M/transcription elongation factor TFIIS
METAATDEIIDIKPEGNIRKCPACSYTDGFHVSFQIRDRSKEGEVVLICPNCHQRFRMGWKVRIE